MGFLLKFRDYSWLGWNKLSGNIPEMGSLKDLKTLYVNQKSILFSLCFHYFFYGYWLFIDSSTTLRILTLFFW